MFEGSSCSKLTDIFCRCFLEQFQVGSSNYYSWKLIDEGGFSFVYQVYDNHNKQYALKKMIAQDQESLEKIHREINIHKQLKHKHILPLIDFALQDETTAGGKTAFLLLPLLEFSLFDFILVQFGLKEMANVPINERGDLSYETLRRIICQVCSGLEYLHNLQEPICHRDFKPGNVLISFKANKLNCSIMDFGSAVQGIVSVPDKTSALVVQETAESESSMAYRAYELWDPQVGEDISVACDLWSLGCLLYSLFFGKGMSPFECFLDKEMKPQLEPCTYVKVMSEVKFPSLGSLKITNLTEARYSKLAGFCKDLLKHNPNERLSAREIRNAFS